MFQKIIAYFRSFADLLDASTKRLLLISCFVGVYVFAIESSLVFVLQGFFASIDILPQSTVLLPSYYPRGVISCIGILVLIGFMRALGVCIRFYLSGAINQGFMKNSRQDIMGYSFANAGIKSNHVVISVFNEKVHHAGIVISRSSEFFVSSISFIFLSVTGFLVAPKEFILGLSLLLILVFPLKILGKKISVIGKELNDSWIRVNENLILGLKNFFFLRVYGKMNAQFSKGKEELSNYENYFKRYYLISSIRNSYPQFIGILIVAIIVLISHFYIKTPSIKLVTFIYLFIRIAQSASEANTFFGEIKLYWPSIELLHEWKIKEGDDELNPPDKKELVVNAAGIAFKLHSVSFAYPDARNILENFSLGIQSGDRVVIKGSSGSGKSTFVGLLLGLIKPTGGNILVNGIDVSDCKNQLLSKIAYVGPEPFMIPGTLRENLLYGNNQSNLSNEDLMESLRKVDLSFLSLDQYLHEYAQLSTGQKQRISIARALLRNPTLIIFDEATSNLDEATETEIVNELGTVLAGKTAVIISHKSIFDKLSTSTLNFPMVKV